MSFAISDRVGKTWPGGVVPYEKKLYRSIKEQGSLIDEAIECLHSNTPIRFKPRQGENNYLLFEQEYANSDCSKMKTGCRGGMQNISIQHFRDAHSILHMICHVLGLEHEHRRPDRDNHVFVIFDWIVKDFHDLFSIADNEFTMIGPYDVRSIMQIHSHCYTASQYRPCMLSKINLGDPPNERDIVRNMKLTQGDVAGLRFLYSDLAWN